MHKFLILALTALFLLSISACNNKKKEKDKTKIQYVNPTYENIKKLKQKILENPKNSDLYNQLAILYVQLDSIDPAFRNISMALNIDSTKANYFNTLSDVYMLAGFAQNALAALEKGLSHEPDNIAVLLKKAELHLYFKQYENTLSMVDKVLQLDDVNANAYFIKAWIFLEKTDTAKAITFMQKAVELNQKYFDAYYKLGELFAAKKNTLAVDYFNNALNLDPKSIETHYALGLYYQENDFLNEALAAYSNLLVVDSTHKNTHFNIGYIHMVKLNLFSEAIKHFDRAIQYDNNYYQAYYNKGYCYELLGDINNAKIEYNKALAIMNNYDDAIKGLNRLDKIVKK